MSSGIYCSIGDVPKNKHRGTMKECVEKKQVRYYGIKKVDKILLATLNKEKKKKKSLDKLKEHEAKYVGRLQKIKREYDKEMKKKENEKNEKLGAELKSKYNKVAQKINDLRKEINKLI